MQKYFQEHILHYSTAEPLLWQIWPQKTMHARLIKKLHHDAHLRAADQEEK